MNEGDIKDIVATLRECAEDSRKVEGDYYADQFATDASVFDDAADEIERLRLTDKERAAIGWAIMECEAMPTEMSREAADTLRSLLERTK